jgi:Fe2+ or Zn2+ uptake regulation protein
MNWPYFDTQESNIAIKISREILEYLLENPNAQDTQEGIVEWWLLQQEITRSTGLVRGALNILVNQGFLLQHRASDMKTYYRVNREKHEEIALLLEKNRGVEIDDE